MFSPQQTSKIQVHYTFSLSGRRGKEKKKTNLKDLKLSTEYLKCFTVGNDPLKSAKGKQGESIPVLHNFEASYLISQNFHPESLLQEENNMQSFREVPFPLVEVRMGEEGS